jgi:hypothetical protein
MRFRLSRALTLLAFGSVALGCNDDAVEVTQRSLQASSEVTFVCATREVAGAQLEGREQADCPDFDSGLTTLFALVTQTSTEEVAIVDVARADVVDVDARVPGFSFLRLPSRPGDIVTTPGGGASFVGLTGVGRTGIAAIPTTCLEPAVDGHPVRDVTSFSACRLPGPPGDMVVLVEPPGDDGIRTECDAASPLESGVDTPPGAVPWDGTDAGRSCPANLTTEQGPAGRRKLVITLPDSGELVVVDAQGVLDREPGKFEACTIEARLPLRADVDPAGARQTLPPDQVMYRDASRSPLPVTHDLFSRGLCLPTHASMTDHDVERVLAVLRTL